MQMQLNMLYLKLERDDKVKVKYNSNLLEVTIKKTIQDSLDYLQEANLILTNSFVPKKFSHATTTEEKHNNLKTKINELNSYIDWINSVDKIFESTVKIQKEKLNKIENNQIRRRKTI